MTTEPTILESLDAAQRQQVDEQLQELTRGAVDVIPDGGLAERVAESVRDGRPLRIKAGFDPTAPDLHLGHAVLLQKLRQFQIAGHQVIFLIGDFTARIGDPTGRTETRPPLTAAEIDANAETYADQVFRILDRDKTEVRRNSEWLDAIPSDQWLRMASVMTVARMLEREDFSTRFRENRPIRVHEFMYPLIQGYDSVALDADVELGGTDQTFNLLVGRDMQKFHEQRQQVVLTMPLLEGLDGEQKMSKSYGNAVGILEDPSDQFGKLMSVSDDLMIRYYTLLSDRPGDEVAAAIEAGDLHPMDAKKELAAEIVGRFYDSAAADSARSGFENVFSHGDVPDDMPTAAWALADGPAWLPRIVADQDLAQSLSEARRLLKQGAIKVDGDPITEPGEIDQAGEYVVKVGKRRFLKLVVSD